MTTTVGLPDGGTTTLLDQAYQFGNQHYQAIDPPLALKTGDQMHIECTYDNRGPTTLTYGESTTKNEMCTAFTYRYPALAAQAAAAGASPGLPHGDCIR